MWMNGGIDPRILSLGTRWRWVVSFTSRPLYLRGKNLDTHLIEGWVGLRAGKLPGVKQSENEIDSPPCCAEIMYTWNSTTTPTIRLHSVMLRPDNKFRSLYLFVLVAGFCEHGKEPFVCGRFLN
jgi:hypothetical protein